MVEVKLGLRTVNVPFIMHIPNVTDEMFDELVDEDIKAELIDGVMIVHSPATPRHDKVAHFLRTLMGCHAGEKDIGEIFGPDSLINLALGRRFGPDIFLLEQSRVPCPLPKEFDLTPDLIVEVLSDSNWEHDLEVKRPAYQEAGVKELWFVDPIEETILIDCKQRKKYVTKQFSQGKVASAVLTGFWIDATWLWCQPLPKELACLRKIMK